MRAHLRIRPADLTERSGLEELECGSRLGPGGGEPDSEAEARVGARGASIGDGAIEEGRLRVLERDGELLGFSEWSRTSRREWELERLFVAHRATGRGHGSRLLVDVLQLARHQGVRRISLTAEPEAVTFFEQHGFERLGEVRTEFGPALRMRLDFTHA